MDGEAVREIRDLAERITLPIGGKTFSVSGLVPVDTDPPPAALKVSTLTALRDYLQANIDKLEGGGLMLHVEGPCAVDLIGAVQGDWNKRTVWIRAEREALPVLKFGAFMDHEAFMIGLQTAFESTADLSLLLSILASVKADSVTTSADDMTSQTVTARSGVSLAESVKVPSPVKLRPYRTFREFQQPESPFILRLRNTDGMPGCMLIDAAGEEWKTTAVEAIRKWLAENIKDVAVIA